jgi:hypothetical protein
MGAWSELAAEERVHAAYSDGERQRRVEYNTHSDRDTCCGSKTPVRLVSCFHGKQHSCAKQGPRQSACVARILAAPHPLLHLYCTALQTMALLLQPFAMASLLAALQAMPLLQLSLNPKKCMPYAGPGRCQAHAVRTRGFAALFLDACSHASATKDRTTLVCKH